MINKPNWKEEIRCLAAEFNLTDKGNEAYCFAKALTLAEKILKELHEYNKVDCVLDGGFVMADKPQSKRRNKYMDCAHCGQDLNLSPGAEDEIEIARIEG